MGLIKAALDATKSTLRDQWEEYFYVDALAPNVIAVKAKRKENRLFGKNRGDDNIITNGSGVVVSDGQCAIIVAQGDIIDVCAEPGEYTYNNTISPTIFVGDLGDAIKDTFQELTKRFVHGGAPAADQRIYYFNTKEMTGNKYGTPNPIPFRVVDERAGIDIDVSIRCFGEYSFRVTDPVRFYRQNSGNFRDIYTVDEISGQMRSELLSALQPAFARISAEGVRYSALPGRTSELCAALKEELKQTWGERGITIQSIAISSLTADEEDEKMLKEMQRKAAYADPKLAAANLADAQAQAMKDAAKNPGGPMNGFLGVNMAQSAGGVNAAQLFNMASGQNAEPAQNAAPAQEGTAAAAGEWYCPNCGTKNSGNFCPKCGTKRPV